MLNFLATAAPGWRPLFVLWAIVMVLGMASAALIIARYLPGRQLRISVKPWGLPELGWWLAVVLGVMVLANLAYVFLAVWRGNDGTVPSAIVLPVEFLMRTALLGALALWLRRRQIGLRAAFGLDALPVRLAVGWGLGFALAVLPLVGLLLVFINAVGHLTGIDVSDQPIVAMFRESDSPMVLVGLIVLALVVAPVSEETLFRGCAYPALKARFGFAPACLIVSAGFALIHFHAPSLVPLLVLAVGLTLAYELTGSLLTSIVMHAAFNGIMLIQLFIAES